jgi:diaminopimelate epimerase
MQLNRRYTHIFPKGINVNFVNIPTEKNVIEYRCFERGINKETLACGTGALASAFVSQRLKLIEAEQITVWPYRSRWYDPDAFILVDQKESHWSLFGKPVMLLEGKFDFDRIFSQQIAVVQSENATLNKRHQIQKSNPCHSASINY